MTAAVLVCLALAVVGVVTFTVWSIGRAVAMDEHA